MSSINTSYIENCCSLFTPNPTYPKTDSLISNDVVEDGFLLVVAEGVEERAGDGGVGRGEVGVLEPVHMDRTTDPDARAEYLRRETVDVLHLCSAAREDDAGMKTVDDILVLKCFPDGGEELQQTGVHHGVARPAGDRPVVHERVFSKFDPDA